MASSFVVESTVFALAALPAVVFFRWHATWPIDSSIVRTLVLAMALVPSYAIFAVLLMALSAGAMRLLGWRPEAPAEMVIAELGWPLCNWARYQISAHVVALFAGGLLRATSIWSAYMRWNGARFGRRVWVNSLGVTDHCLLEFGDDVVIVSSGAVGQLREIDPDHVVTGGGMSTHGLNVADGIQLARRLGCLPATLRVFGSAVRISGTDRSRGNCVSGWIH